MSQEETRSRRFPLACCQISELNCSKAPLNRRSSTTILSNICLIATPILAPNLPISGNTAEYPATGSSIKNPVFMRLCKSKMSGGKGNTHTPQNGVLLRNKTDISPFRRYARFALPPVWQLPCFSLL